MIKYTILIITLLTAPGLIVAKEATPLAKDPAIEARMMTMAEDLRCLVCQNQSLAASESDFAHDVRREIKKMMKEGKTDQEIKDFLVQRYGDFILFRPPVKEETFLLWFGPLILLIVGATALVLVLRRRNRLAGSEQPISEADHRRAEALLQGQDEAPATGKGDGQVTEG